MMRIISPKMKLLVLCGHLLLVNTTAGQYFKNGGCYKMNKMRWMDEKIETHRNNSNTFAAKLLTQKINNNISSTEREVEPSKKKITWNFIQAKFRVINKKDGEGREKLVYFCKNECHDRDFKFAGVYKGGDCLCSENMPQVEDLSSGRECNISCINDTTSNCGGKEHIHVHEIFEDSGCYKQKEKDETSFWGRKTKTNSNTVTSCIQTCLDEGFKFAAVGFGKFCKCGNKTPSRKDLLPPHKCHFECSGDRKQICGGSWKNNIYKTALNFGEGCFKENNVKDLILKENLPKSISNTEQECRENCSKRGFIFGGLEGGDKCSCGNDFPPVWKKVPLSECNVPCTGNSRQKCGGDHKIYIFNTIKVGGCFHQNVTKSTFQKTIKLEKNSVTVCTSYCKESNFYLFGVQGDTCSCGHIPPKMENEGSPEKCNKTCPGNPSETCGGLSSMNVFPISGKNQSKRSRSQGASTPIVLSIATAAVVVIIILIFARLKQKKKVKTTKEDYKRLNFRKLLEGDPNLINEKMPLSEQQSVLPYNREKYEISKDDIKINHLLGGGQCGDVFLGIVGHTKVAIKKVKDMNDYSQVNSICGELKILSNTGGHMNLVNLLYASTSEDIYVVLEYCSYGDMKKFLNYNADNFIYNVRYPDHNQENIFTGQLLLKWSYSIAKGMEYLSSKNIMHGDLAARNILLSTNYVPKISDFGLSKVVLYGNEYQKTTRRMIPWAWMAIEYLKTGAFHLKSDVWSFGVVLWEMYSLGGKPYDTQPYEEVKLKLVNGERLLAPDYMEQLDENNYMYSNVMLLCFEEEIAKRPNFSDVVDLITLNLSKDVLLEYKQMTKNFDMTQMSIKVIKNKTSCEENKAVTDEIRKKKAETSKSNSHERVTKKDENDCIKLDNINKKKVEYGIDECYIEFDDNFNLPLSNGKEYSKELSNKLSDEKTNDDGTDKTGSNEYIQMESRHKGIKIPPDHTNN